LSVPARSMNCENLATDTPAGLPPQQIKRLLAAAVDGLPDEALRVAARLVTPPKRMSQREARARAPRWMTPQEYAAARHREDLSRAVHLLAMGLLIDALDYQSAGSGNVLDDIRVLAGELLATADVQIPFAASDEITASRRAWDKLRLKLTPLVLRRDDGSCVYCARPAQCVDHRTPLARGGSNDISNLAAACDDCNRAKGDRTEVEYRRLLGATA